MNAGIGLGVGVATFGVGYEFGTVAGIVSGAVSAAVMTGISNVEAGHSFLGTDMLDAAIISAGSGALTYGLQHAIAVTEASQYAAYQQEVAQARALGLVAGATALQSQAQTSAMMARAIGQASGSSGEDASTWAGASGSSGGSLFAMGVPTPGTYSPFRRPPQPPATASDVFYSWGVGAGAGLLAVTGLELAGLADCVARTHYPCIDSGRSLGGGRRGSSARSG